jgi:hypothetical protein
MFFNAVLPFATSCCRSDDGGTADKEESKLSTLRTISCDTLLAKAAKVA